MKKSKFNLSHNASLTASMGNLIPFVTIDCLPNDSHRLSVDSFIRAQPMMAPLMHNVRFYTQYWFVPYRILWNNWTDFITGGLDGTSAPTFPTIKITPETSSLADYFGIPVNDAELEVSALPFRAYTEIWNTRYRDEDLQLELPISYDDGVDTDTNTTIQRCSWAKDYFTTARPWTQRGSQISVPVMPGIQTGEAYAVYHPVIEFDGNVVTSKPSTVDFGSVIISGYGDSVNYDSHSVEVQYNYSGMTYQLNFSNSLASGTVAGYFAIKFPYSGSGPIDANTGSSLGKCSDLVYYQKVNVTFGAPISYSDSPVSNFHCTFESTRVYPQKTCLTNIKFSLVNLTCEVSTVEKVSQTGLGALNIRDLRLSSALQRYQERSLEYGNRYEEFIQREFGIRPRDSRIQRPEYLGGSKSVLQISEVLQTSEGTNTGVGTMRGHGVGGLRQRPIRFRAPEHGVIIGLFSIRPDSVYSQGLARQWTKFSKLDYFVPELANVGMQEVFQSEIYADGTNSKTLFGYSPRYEEYRKLPNRISGEFRKLLNYWNLARNFEAPPVLNSSFITMNPTKRVFAEQTQDSFLVMLRNNIKSYRVVPKRAKNILK